MSKQIENNSPREHVKKSRRGRSGVLTREDIKYYDVISDLDEKCLNSASYDLRLDDRHLVYNHKKNQWECVYIGKYEGLDSINMDSPMTVSYKDSLVLPRFGTAIIQLKENVNTFACLNNISHPTIICGRFDLKLKMTMKNLTSQQATQVEPGYKGKLYCLITNQSDKDIVLQEDDKIATIEFSYANQLNENTVDKLIININEVIREKYVDKKTKQVKKYCNENGINDVRFFMTEKYALSSQGSLNTLVSQQDMKDFVGTEIDKIVENKVKWYKDSTEHSIRAIQWFITACLAILLFMSGKLVDSIKKDVSDMKTDLSEMKKPAGSIAYPSAIPKTPLVLSPSISATSNKSSTLGLSPTINATSNKSNEIGLSPTYSPKTVISENTAKNSKMRGYSTASCSSVLNFNVNCNK